MENNIKLLIVKFKNQLTHDEVKYFRGAVIRNLSDKNVLFHNHEEEGLRYAYPLIQYKRMQNCAAIVCLNEGTEVIGNFFSTYQPHFMIGNHPVEMKIDKLNPVFSCIAQTDNQMMTYQLSPAGRNCRACAVSGKDTCGQYPGLHQRPAHSPGETIGLQDTAHRRQLSCDAQGYPVHGIRPHFYG